MPAHILVNAKMYAALVGSIATALLGTYAADTPVGQVLTVVAVVATAIATWAVPNADAPSVGAHREAGAIDLGTALVVITLLLILLVLFGVLPVAR